MRINFEGPVFFGGSLLEYPASPDIVTVFATSESKVVPLADKISVTSFGAAPGGEHQQVAFQAAIDKAAAEGKAVEVPAGEFSFSAGITLPENAQLIMDPATVLDFSAVKGAFISVKGTAGEKKAIAPLNRGSKKVDLGDSAPGGGLIHIASEDVVDAHSTKIFRGELATVSAPGELLTPLADAYTTNPVYAVVSPVKRVLISGGTIRGAYESNKNQIGIELTYAVGATITGVRVEGVDDTHIRMNNCLGIAIENCEFDWAIHNTRAYAVSFKDATADSYCINSRFVNVRHALSTNNSVSTTSGGVVRRIVFQGNTCEGTSTALGGSMGPGDCIDTHTAAEDIYILNNTVRGASGSGINVECIRAVISGNRVFDSGAHGIYYHNESDSPGEVTITGNHVSGAGRTGITAATGTRGTTTACRSIQIQGNRVKDTVGDGIRVGGTVVENGVLVSGNTVSGCQRPGILIWKVDGCSVTGNHTADTVNRGIGLDAVNHTLVSGNVSINNTADVDWWGLHVVRSSNSRVEAGAIYSASSKGSGVRVNADSPTVVIGPTEHVDAPTKLTDLRPKA